MASNRNLSRRDVIKLLGLLPLSYLVGKASRYLDVRPPLDAQGNRPGVIVIVLDALSALNLSLYGYERKTSTNLERFVENSIVYHAHSSAANFTSSGTSSILTGTHPWTHRAFHYEGLIAPGVVDMNIFRHWDSSKTRLGFTQNPWADLLLHQFSNSITQHVSYRTFSLASQSLSDTIFRNDKIIAYKGVESYALEMDPGVSSSTLLALARKALLLAGKSSADKKWEAEYPLGIPKTLNDENNYFLLEDLFDGVMNLVRDLPSSSFAYIHLFPPHYPYAPRRNFLEQFEGDGWIPGPKQPAHYLRSVPKILEDETMSMRLKYDAFIATVDEDLGRLFDFMKQNGVFDRNYVVLTSDHGDIYERGVWGHTNEYLYEPLVRVPLVVLGPGITGRLDVHSPTSSVDLLPTLLSLTGRPVPAASEGVLLPGLGGKEDLQRSVFSIDTKSSHVRGKIRSATVSLRKDRYKLISYFGREGFDDAEELFDLKNDPGETNNLAGSKPETLAELKNELREKMDEANQPYAS